MKYLKCYKKWSIIVLAFLSISLTDKAIPKTDHVNLSLDKTGNLVHMHPGEKKKIALKDSESYKFEFQLPKTGSCMLKLSSESLDAVTLNMGMMNALIKKEQPMVIKVTRDAENSLPTLEFVNVTGKENTDIYLELSEMLPLANDTKNLEKNNKTQDQLDDIVFDSHTRLEWVKKGISLTKIFEKLKADGKINRIDEISKYVNGLSIEGHSDWRIPTEKELETLLAGDNFPLEGSMDWFVHSLTEHEGLLASTALRNSSNTSDENKGLWPVRGPLLSSSKKE